VFISHDRRLLDNVADVVYEIKEKDYIRFDRYEHGFK
jgi:ATPase subunit of ABC transporter with duplicated ATPase domains